MVAMNATRRSKKTGTRTGADLMAAERRRISQRVGRYFAKEQWAELETFLREVLRRCPEDHWLFQLLARMRPETMATGEGGEGLRWARGLIADAHYRLGRLAEDEGRKAEARRRYRRYFELVELPSLSITSRRDVEARLRALSRTPSSPAHAGAALRMGAGG
jgi:hypothetical protein